MAKIIKEFNAEILGGKRALKYYYAYLASTNINLGDVYQNYSPLKKMAFEHCLKEKTKDNEKGLDLFDGFILTHNTGYFTYGYIVQFNKQYWLIAITPTHKFMIDTSKFRGII